LHNYVGPRDVETFAGQAHAEHATLLQAGIEESGWESFVGDSQRNTSALSAQQTSAAQWVAVQFQE